MPIQHLGVVAQQTIKQIGIYWPKHKNNLLKNALVNQVKQREEIKGNYVSQMRKQTAETTKEKQNYRCIQMVFIGSFPGRLRRLFY